MSTTTLPSSRVLRLTLKKRWFDMIACGVKKEEYREIKDWIISRLHGKTYEAVEFSNGYGAHVPKVTVEYLGWGTGIGRAEWGATPMKPTIIIRLGRVLRSPLGSGTCSVLLERGEEFRFNDHVCIEMLLGVPLEKRTGRLVQVRKGCGQFGSNIYFVRLRDGGLVTFENALIRHVDDERFVDSFYVSNGQPAPVIPDQSPDETDSVVATYSIGGKWPETGFIVDAPKQPETPGCFSIAISSPNAFEAGDRLESWRPSLKSARILLVSHD